MRSGRISFAVIFAVMVLGIESAGSQAGPVCDFMPESPHLVQDRPGTKSKIAGKKGEVLFKPVADSGMSSLKLKASSSEQRVKLGEQFSITTALVNNSNQTVQLEHFVPWNIFPEVWDATGRKKLPDAPSCAYDQILQRRTTRLVPGEEMQLRSVPIVLKDTPVGDARSKEPPGMRAYWNSVKPGKYVLRYKIDLKDFLPGASGTLVSNDVAISVEP